jgi:hypothetical protein
MRFTLSKYKPMTLFIGGLLTLAVAFPLWAEHDQKGANPDDVINGFFEGVKTRDLEAVMKHVTVPWLAEDGTIVTDAKQLRKLWQQKLEKPDLFKPKKLEAADAVQARDLKKSITDEKSCKLFEQVLGKDDGAIVTFMEKEEIAFRYIVVRLQGGETKIVGGPYKLTYLLKPNRIPEKAGEALAKAEQFEILSLDRGVEDKSANGFHEWKVLGKTVVKAEETRNKLVAAIKQGVEDTEGVTAKCFRPRYGIRVTHDGKTYEFVICCECFKAVVYEDAKVATRFMIAASPQTVFDQVLRDAGIPLAKDCSLP